MISTRLPRRLLGLAKLLQTTSFLRVDVTFTGMFRSQDAFLWFAFMNCLKAAGMLSRVGSVCAF